MKFMASIIVVLSAVVASQAKAADPVATVAGSKSQVKTARQGSKLLLHAGEAARAFGWEAKVVTPGKLLTLCREGEGGLCIPLLLKKAVNRTIDKELFVEAAALGRALRFRIDEGGGKVVLIPAKNTPADENADLPAYNAAWGKGRGFRTGQTLPDIPLYDLNNKEVRFSKFLGQQYIIYCWASW
jgi:hypothetical protein